jgi:hypothetical protein
MFNTEAFRKFWLGFAEIHANAAVEGGFLVESVGEFGKVLVTLLGPNENESRRRSEGQNAGFVLLFPWVTVPYLPQVVAACAPPNRL